MFDVQIDHLAQRCAPLTSVREVVLVLDILKQMHMESLVLQVGRSSACAMAAQALQKTHPSCMSLSGDELWSLVSRMFNSCVEYSERSAQSPQQIILASTNTCSCGEYSVPAIDQATPAVVWNISGQQKVWHVPRRCRNHRSCDRRRWYNYESQSGKHTVLGSVHQDAFFFLTAGCGFTRDFIEDTSARVLRTHATFQGLADLWGLRRSMFPSEHHAQPPPKSFRLYLSRAYFLWSLARSLEEFHVTEADSTQCWWQKYPVELNRHREDTPAVLKRLLPVLQMAFQTQWLHAARGSVFVMDGHMKCHRARCPAIVSSADDLWGWSASVSKSCEESPAGGNFFCKTHAALQDRLDAALTTACCNAGYASARHAHIEDRHLWARLRRDLGMSLARGMGSQ